MVKFKTCKVFIASKAYANEYSPEVKPIHFLLPKVSSAIGHLILDAQGNVLLLTHYVGQIYYMEYSFPKSKLFFIQSTKQHLWTLLRKKKLYLNQIYSVKFADFWWGHILLANRFTLFFLFKSLLFICTSLFFSY